MAGEEEANGVQLARQPIGRHPRFGSAKLDRRRRPRRAGEEVVLAAALVFQRPGAGGHDAIDIGEGGCPVDAELIERAGGGERLQRALVDQTRVYGAGERRNVAEGPALGSLGTDMIDCLTPDITQRGKRIADGAVAREEACLREVHRWRLDANPHAPGFLGEAVELVGVADVERHGGRQELDRVVGLEIRGLIGDQRICGSVRLVEAVAREFGDQLEDELGAAAIHTLANGALDEAVPLLRHLLLDLLAHGAAEQIGLAERKT